MLLIERNVSVMIYATSFFFVQSLRSLKRNLCILSIPQMGLWSFVAIALK